MKGLLLTLLFTSGLYGASVDDLTFTLIDGDTAYAVSGCKNDASGPLDIPSTYSGLPVISIGYGAFFRKSGLTSITIPGSVTSIGEWAFADCSGLNSITIPNSVTSIGYYAFYNCSGLSSITISDGVTSIGEYAFPRCISLTSITIPDSVTSIGSGAFYNCSGLNSITIGNGVTSIGNYAFDSCSSLTSITIPDSVTFIGIHIFQLCSGLTNINVGSGNEFYTSVDGVLFNYTESTLLSYPPARSVSLYTIPDTVTSIGKFAFSRCSGLSSITIPNSVTSIGEGAFSNCTSLTSITIPNSVTSIGDYAFLWCYGLGSITFEGNAPTFGQNVFLPSNSLTAYYYDDATGFTSPTWQGIQSEAISRPAPMIAGIEKLEVGVNLWFNSASGQSHRIEFSNDLENWTMVEDEIISEGDTVIRYYDTVGIQKRFYRVKRND